MEILTWKEVREEVKKVNASIANVIDDLNLNEAFKFYKIAYPFGTPVFENGVLFVPNKDNLFVPINDPTISNQYKEYIGYDSVPFGMILKNSLSNSFEAKDNFASIAVFYSGQLFGLRELFESEHSLLRKKHWNLYAGTRAIFSTTKISNWQKYQLIKRKFKLKSKLPEHFRDHFFVFRELINHPHFLCNWSTTLLLFGRSIRDKLIEKNVWPLLQTFFLKHVWEQSIGWRFDLVSGNVWNLVIGLLREGRFKNFGCQAEILKHIVRISLGYVPCFISNDRVEVSAPLTLLKEILIDEYKVDYCPTIMVPGYISEERYHNGYYSVSGPILAEDARINKSKEISEIVRDIQVGYEFIRKGISNNKAYLGNSTLQNLFKEVQLKFFHSTLSLLTEDPSLAQLPKKYGNGILPFNGKGSFFRGTIKIELQGRGE